MGVTINSKLSWNAHINIIVTKANRLMGLIKRSVGFKVPSHVKLNLYNSLVRSNVEYCSEAWNGLSKKKTESKSNVYNVLQRDIY